jgi:hypothetical protein
VVGLQRRRIATRDQMLLSPRQQKGGRDLPSSGGPSLTAFRRDADQGACHRLYEVTAKTIKEVDASLQVGIPASLFRGGFGLLTHRQIKKPAFHLYAFMARLGDQVLARGSHYLITRDAEGGVAILAWTIEATPWGCRSRLPARRHSWRGPG